MSEQAKFVQVVIDASNGLVLLDDAGRIWVEKTLQDNVMRVREIKVERLT